MLERVFLGEVDYFGKSARAYREIYKDHWSFVLVTENGKHTLMKY